MNWLAKFFTREAEQRLAVAEDRASFLEQELGWMRQRITLAETEKDRAIKMLANVFGQMLHGFQPYPEVNGLPPRPETSEEVLAALADQPSPREVAHQKFVDSEMELYEQIFSKNGNK